MLPMNLKIIDASAFVHRLLFCKMHRWMIRIGVFILMWFHRIIVPANVWSFGQWMHRLVFNNDFVQGRKSRLQLTINRLFLGCRCVCNYEVRNTTTMKVIAFPSIVFEYRSVCFFPLRSKVVVIIIMVAISLLFIYMSFLLCLDPLMNQNSKSKKPASTTNTTRQSKHYERQVNDEVQVDNPTQECVFSEPAAVSTLPTTQPRSAAVLNMLAQGQSKWRKKVGGFLPFPLLNVVFQGTTTTTVGLQQTWIT